MGPGPPGAGASSLEAELQLAAAQHPGAPGAGQLGAGGPSLEAELQLAAAQQAAVLAAAAAACWRLADVDILLELLALPRLRANAQAVFERCVARGAFGEQAMIMVMERRRTQSALSAAAAAAAAAAAGGAGMAYPLPAASLPSVRRPTGTLPLDSAGSEIGGAGPRGERTPSAAKGGGRAAEPGALGHEPGVPQALLLGDGTYEAVLTEGVGPLPGDPLGGPLGVGEPGLGPPGELLLEESDFGASLSLAEALAGSEEQRVREFVGTLYAVLYKIHADDAKRERILRGLVARATRHPQGTPDCDLGLDILSFLVRASSTPFQFMVPAQGPSLRCQLELPCGARGALGGFLWGTLWDAFCWVSLPSEVPRGVSLWDAFGGG